MEKMMNYAIGGMLALIGILVGLIIIIGVVTPLFPTLITQVVGLSTLGNFTFASLFTADGFVPLLLSVFVLLLVIGLPIAGVLLAVGYMKSKHGRR